jgi:hypothetical protein
VYPLIIISGYPGRPEVLNTLAKHRYSPGGWSVRAQASGPSSIFAAPVTLDSALVPELQLQFTGYDLTLQALSIILRNLAHHGARSP